MKNFEVQHTIRLYDPELIAEIGRAFDAHHREFRNKNEFLTELLRLGVKQMNPVPPTPTNNGSIPPCAAADDLTNEIKEIHAITTETAMYLKTQFKKLYVHVAVTEKLLAAIYNINTSELAGTPPLSEKVEDGFFDDLPMRFEKIIVSLESRYGLR